MSQIFVKDETIADRRKFFLNLVDQSTSDAAIGVTGTPRLSKNGGSSSDTTNDLVEVDSTNMPGLYYVELTAAELDTSGFISISFKDDGTSPTDRFHETATVQTAKIHSDANHLDLYAGSEGPGVYLDATAANTSTVIGVDGISSNPVSTLTAAQTIAAAIGSLRIYLFSRPPQLKLLIGGTADISDYEIIGQVPGEESAGIRILSGANVNNCRFLRCWFTDFVGGSDEHCYFESCIFDLTVDIGGAYFRDCSFQLLSLTIRDNTYNTSVINCAGALFLTFVGTNFETTIQIWGEFTADGVDGASSLLRANIDGLVVINNTCVDGFIIVFGVCTLDDQSGAGCSIVDGRSVDALVSSRATQSQILSDATPFAGANIDTTISSRATPGAAMALVTNAISATELASNAIDEIADGVLSRPLSNVETAIFRSLAGAIAKLVNKVEIVGNALTIFKTDDSTAWNTQIITSDPTADPITGLDTV